MPPIKTIQDDGIERERLPQIPLEKLSDFVQNLRLNGTKVGLDTVAAEKIHPIQSEINQDKVNAMRGDLEKIKKIPLIVSKDLNLMDGHHRWYVLNQKDPKTKVRVLHVDLPMKELISLADEFEGSYNASIGETHLAAHIKQWAIKKFDTGYIEWL